MAEADTNSTRPAAASRTNGTDGPPACGNGPDEPHAGRAEALAARLAAVRARIDGACAQAGRAADEVVLLAVSKTFPAADVLALAAAGQRAFGENYVQEGVDKIDRCLAPDGAPAQPAQAARPERVADEPMQANARTTLAQALQWHFIGPLQANKTRAVAERFDWVHSIERDRIAQRLNDQRPSSRQPLDVCVQVNVSGEASKSGCPPGDAERLAHAVAAMPRLRLRGLMAIPEPTDDVGRQRAAFAKLRETYERLRAGGLALDTLSMGMSADLEAAVAEGSTMVRVGTALFGARTRQG